MAIADKTRKILWGRSGNRCAKCRRELVVDATAANDESVVRDECHIISGKGQGPRYDPTFLPDHLDEPENLILLCRVHHKMVDDQHETYTSAVLHKLKANHEKWVSLTLAEQQPPPPVCVRRIKENIPSHLVRLTSGQAVLAIVDGVCAFAFGHDELKLPVEVELISGFFQEAQDYGELWADLEAGNRVNATFYMSTRLEELEQAGFWIFGAREERRLEGGIGSPSPFQVAILNIVRTDSPEIIKVDFANVAEQGSEQTPDAQ